MKELIQPEYAKFFTDAGFAAITFDYRNFGDSEGEPRQHINPWEQIDDLINAYGEARVVELARRFGVSHATVNKVVKRLARDGLVHTRPYRSIFLTEEGRELAEWSRRRHQIVLNFLRSIGVSERTAKLDAEGIEHYVSDDTLAAFARIAAQKKK